MAFLHVDFFSQALSRTVSFRAVIPNDLPPAMREASDYFSRGMKTFFLLHGYSGYEMDWALNSTLVDLAARYHVAFILPSGENSFYLDRPATGFAYATYVGEELPTYCGKLLGISQKKEDLLLGGYSMGGFGALHTAFRYPDRFGGVFALSSALIHNEVKEMKPGSHNGVANYEYYQMMFGDPRELEHSENNPEELVRRCVQNGIPLPRLFLACGTEDFLLKENRSFVAFLRGLEVPLVYQESSGSHDFIFWNKYLEPALSYLLED